jgi:hypothetical protein
MMQCLACGAKMLLMDVVQDYTTKVPAFERQIFKCSACPQIARRLVFSLPPWITRTKTGCLTITYCSMS